MQKDIFQTLKLAAIDCKLAFNEQTSSRIRGKKSRPHKTIFKGYISITGIHTTRYLPKPQNLKHTLQACTQRNNLPAELIQELIAPVEDQRGPMRTISVKHCTIKATILPVQENWVAMMMITTTKASIHACIATDKKGEGGEERKHDLRTLFLQ